MMLPDGPKDQTGDSTWLFCLYKDQLLQVRLWRESTLIKDLTRKNDLRLFLQDSNVFFSLLVYIQRLENIRLHLWWTQSQQHMNTVSVWSWTAGEPEDRRAAEMKRRDLDLTLPVD